VGFGSTCVASGLFNQVRDSPGQLTVRAVAVADGKTLLFRNETLERGRRWTDEIAVAHDGSAVAVGLRPVDRDRPGGYGVMVLTGTGEPRQLPHLRRPEGVGPKGAWIVAHQDRDLRLYRGEAFQSLRCWAPGPGLALVVQRKGGEPKLILADGGDGKPNPGSMAVGKDPWTVTVGGWLVLASGGGAKTVSDTDLLGEGGGKVVEQPNTLALWRWADLAKDANAAPAAYIANPLSVAWNQPAALLAWTGRQVDLVDLTGGEPVRAKLHAADAPVEHAWIDRHLLLLAHAQGRKVIVDAAGKVVWDGKVDDIWIRRRNRAVAARWENQQRRWFLLRLDADPAKRGQTAVQIPPGDYDLALDRQRELLRLTNDTGWWTFGFDGKPIDACRADAAEQKEVPGIEEWEPANGRFEHLHSRLVPKDTGAPADPMARLTLQDAWRFAGAGGASTTMLIGKDRHVYASGKKRGEWSDLGRVEEADRFGLAGRTPVVVSDWEHPKVGAVLAAGPSLVAPDKVPGLAAPPTDHPPGPWRIDWMSFAAPRGRGLVWDPEKVGFRPFRLRSPDFGGLLVVTHSVLIDLDADAAKVVGKTP
jgi:hypothetical protein